MCVCVCVCMSLCLIVLFCSVARKREQTPSSEGLTGQKNDEETEGKEQETQVNTHTCTHIYHLERLFGSNNNNLSF